MKFWIAGFAGAVTGFAQSLPIERAMNTVCTGRLGHEFDGDVIPGTEIYPGIVTGMGWDEAKRIAPKLVGREAIVEPFPGKQMRGEIYFEDHKKQGASEIDFEGPATASPKDELTARFGKPLKLDAGQTGIRQFNYWMPSPPQRFEDLKWCDGPRIYVLHVDEEHFNLSISGPRTKN